MSIKVNFMENLNILTLPELHSSFYFYINLKSITIKLENALFSNEHNKHQIQLMDFLLSDTRKKHNHLSCFHSLNDLLDTYIEYACEQLKQNYYRFINNQNFIKKFKEKKNNVIFYLQTISMIEELKSHLISVEDSEDIKLQKIKKRY